MTNINKMTPKQERNFFCLSIFAGLSIGFGGLISLSLPNTYLSAMAFSIGIYIVMLFGFKLYTGFVPKVFTEDFYKQRVYQIIMCLMGNTMGVLIVALFTRESNFGLVDKAFQLTASKINPVIGLLGGIGCGIVIGLIVLNQHSVMKWILTTPLIMLFILTKMEHCIADIYYMAVANNFNFIFLISVIIGNTIGGYLVGKVTKLKVDF